MSRNLLTVVGLSLLVSSVPSLAHRSHANYDISKWLVIEGTVKQIVLIAPHSIVYLDVKDTAGRRAGEWRHRYASHRDS